MCFAQRKTMQHSGHGQAAHAHQEADDNVHIDILDMSASAPFSSGGFDIPVRPPAALLTL